MKKAIFTLLSIGTLAIAATPATAQLQKGTYLVGGQLANIKFGLGTASSFSFDVTPKVGYFIQDNLAIGVDIPLRFSTVKNQGNTFEYGVGVFGRYYFSPKEMNIDNLLRHGRFFAEAGVGVAGVNGAGAGFNINFGPGYAYFITPNVALETSLKFNGVYGTGNSSGLQLNVGFQIHLPGKNVTKVIRDVKTDVEG